MKERRGTRDTKTGKPLMYTKRLEEAVSYSYWLSMMLSSLISDKIVKQTCGYGGGSKEAPLKKNLQ